MSGHDTVAQRTCQIDCDAAESDLLPCRTCGIDFEQRESEWPQIKRFEYPCFLHPGKFDGELFQVNHTALDHHPVTLKPIAKSQPGQHRPDRHGQQQQCADQDQIIGITRLDDAITSHQHGPAHVD